MNRGSSSRDRLNRRVERLEHRRLLAVDSVGFELETVVQPGVLNQPVTFDVASDGRIFVAEKEGTVAVLDANGARLSTFLDIRGRVNSFQDRGLLSLALDPDFDTNGHVYLNYAKEIDAFNPEITPGVDPEDLDQGSRPGGINALGEVIRVTVSAGDPNLADMTSQTLVHDGFFHVGGSHSVGDIDFDNDDNLIFTWGDGGFNVQARLAAQDPDDPRGKLYRVNKDTFEGVPDNPFYEAGDPSSTRSRVWSLGLRNTWKMTVDTPTGDVYLSEVTDSGPEEINVIRGDGSTTLNLGWPWFTGDNASNRGGEYDPDGDIDGDGNVELPPGFAYESPLIELGVRTQGYFAIVGGAVYRPDATPTDNYPAEFDGLYFFSEIGSGSLYASGQDGQEMLFGELGANEGIADIQLGPDGNLWATSLFTGRIQRVVFTGEGDGIDQAVKARATASRTAGAGPLTVQFDAGASSGPVDANLSYAWDFDGDGGIDSTDVRPIHTYSGVGRSLTKLTVSAGLETNEMVFEIDSLASEPSDGNLALGKPTSQSSTRSGGGASSRAVDGNTSGAFPGDNLVNSVTHTVGPGERTPFWEVDLEQIGDLSSIRLFNRDGLESRLSNFYVMISDTPISSGNPNAAIALPDVKHAFFSGSAGSSEMLDLSDFIDVNGDPIDAADFTGRYVRVQQSSQFGILSLAEVQVFGEAAPVVRFFDPGLVPSGGDLELQVEAYDSGDGIANVQLFLDDQFVRQETFSPYTWNGFGQDDPLLQDLATGEYTLRAVATDDQGLQSSSERVFAVGVEGDYNRDGVVNAADYTVWRDRQGEAADSFTSADGDGDATVGDGDEAVWRANYGRTDQVVPPPDPTHAGEFAGLLINGDEQGDAFDEIDLRFEPHGGGEFTLLADSFTGYDGDRLNDPALDGGWEAVSLGGARLLNGHARGAGASQNLQSFDASSLDEEGVITLEMVSRAREQFRQETALIDFEGVPLLSVGNLIASAGTGFEVENADGVTLLQGNALSSPISFSSHIYFDLRLTYDTATGVGSLEIGPGSANVTPNGPYELVGTFNNPLASPAASTAGPAGFSPTSNSEEDPAWAPLDAAPRQARYESPEASTGSRDRTAETYDEALMLLLGDSSWNQLPKGNDDEPASLDPSADGHAGDPDPDPLKAF
ncbi:Soluble aldose sugar dehydrogenase YliI precursor [Planctomycetes bacterium MalM25]|nr:Soluble aldose sugar dehydrogenase YliI precursor [Planctomycetes bacterium MalM25]